jgi:hypothetical protein
MSLIGHHHTVEIRHLLEKREAVSGQQLQSIQHKGYCLNTLPILSKREGKREGKKQQ